MVVQTFLDTKLTVEDTVTKLHFGKWNYLREIKIRGPKYDA